MESQRDPAHQPDLERCEVFAEQSARGGFLLPSGVGLGGASMEAEAIDSLSGPRVAAVVDSQQGNHVAVVEGLSRLATPSRLSTVGSNASRDGSTRATASREKAKSLGLRADNKAPGSLHDSALHLSAWRVVTRLEEQRWDQRLLTWL